MISASPILLRSRDYQWYWYSSTTNEGDEKWQQYTDIENEIIEDAYNEKKTDVELNGKYMIDLKHMMEYKKYDCSKRRSIKRDQCNNLQSIVCLREERFSSPIATVNSTAALRHVQDDENIFSAYFILIGDNKTFSDIVQEAADGIIKEGTTIGVVFQAKILSEHLLKVKGFGANIKIDRHNNIDVPRDIGQACVSLYSKSSFWHRLMNEILRDCPRVNFEQVKTFGPFCWLL